MYTQKKAYMDELEYLLFERETGLELILASHTPTNQMSLNHCVVEARNGKLRVIDSKSNEAIELDLKDSDRQVILSHSHLTILFAAKGDEPHPIASVRVVRTAP